MFLEVKWHRRRSNQYVRDRVGMSCTELNNNCQSPHKKPCSRFPHCVPLTPGKIIHLNTFYLHLHKADKSVVPAPDVLTHFASPPDEQVWTAAVLGNRGLSKAAFIPPLSREPGDMWHCTSLIQRVHPRGEGLSAHLSSPVLLPCWHPWAPWSSSSRSVTVPNTGTGWTQSGKLCTNFANCTYGKTCCSS